MATWWQLFSSPALSISSGGRSTTSPSSARSPRRPCSCSTCWASCCGGRGGSSAPAHCSDLTLRLWVVMAQHSPQGGAAALRRVKGKATQGKWKVLMFFIWYLSYLIFKEGCDTWQHWEGIHPMRLGGEVDHFNRCSRNQKARSGVVEWCSMLTT